MASPASRPADPGAANCCDSRNIFSEPSRNDPLKPGSSRHFSHFSPLVISPKNIHAASLDWARTISLDAWLDFTPATAPVVPAPPIVTADSASARTAEPPAAQADPGNLLIALAKDLRNIRYRRGGTSPKTGFDCSGFVRYVFQHALGIDLPVGSAAQFRVGDQIDRSQMQAGDLVFFRIAGQRISHVGIYVAEGRFIHAPSAGKVVRVDSLEETYWARRFAGAKRPEAIARI